MIVEPRVVTAADVAQVTATMSAAFQEDPVWSWAFPDPAKRQSQLARLWGFFIVSALRYPWVWTTPGHESVSVWIPPGGTELAAGEEQQMEELLFDLLGPWAETVMEALAHFEHAHPRDEPHYYLSFVGTHPDHRGHGLGVALLAANLALIDAEHAPAYLESSNPANDKRYGRLGFVRCGEFAVIDGGPVITTMWRDAR